MAVFSTLAFSAALLASATHDVGIGSAANVSAGLIPADATAAAQPGADLTWSISGGYRLSTARTTFILAYVPQLYVRQPDVLNVGRPLFLHRLIANYSTELTRRSSFASSLEGIIGETSYVSSRSILDAGTTNISSSVLNIASIAMTNQYRVQVTRRSSFEVATQAGAREPLDVLLDRPTDETVLASFPASFNAGVRVSSGYTLTSVDAIGVAVGGNYYYVDDSRLPEPTEVDTEFFTTDAAVNWRRSLSRNSSLSVNVGAVMSTQNAENRTVVSPTGIVSYGSNWSKNGISWGSSVSGGVRGFFDVISARYLPQAFAGYSLSAAWNRRWTAGLSAFASTSATEDPNPLMQSESNVSLELPMTYALERGLQLRFGVRAAARGPHVSQIDDEPWQPETVGFVGIRGTFGTDPLWGAWLP